MRANADAYYVNPILMCKRAFLTIRIIFCKLYKHEQASSTVGEGSNSQVKAESSLSLEQHQTLILLQSIVIERQVVLIDFNELIFEDWFLPKVIGAQGWGTHLPRAGMAPMDIFRVFYATVHLVPNISNNAWVVTIRNTQVIFSLDELVRFMSYERPVNAFPTIELPKEEMPSPADVFWTTLGMDTVVLKGSNMKHGQLLPFWHFMHLIFAYYIDQKKHTIKRPIARNELMLLVAHRTPVDLAMYIFLTIWAEALSYELSALSYGLLLTQFLLEMIVPEGTDEAKGRPLLLISKTTLSRSMDYIVPADSKHRQLLWDIRSSLHSLSWEIPVRAWLRDIIRSDQHGQTPWWWIWRRSWVL